MYFFQRSENARESRVWRPLTEQERKRVVVVCVCVWEEGCLCVKLVAMKKFYCLINILASFQFKSAVSTSRLFLSDSNLNSPY